MGFGIAEALSKDAILLGSSWDCFESTVAALVEALAASGQVPQPLATQAVRLVCEREEISSTAMVDIGVAIPHARCEGLNGIVAALAAAPAGVYEAGQGLPISIVVLVLTSPKLTTEHLTFLASLSLMLQSDPVRAAIETARTPDEVMQIIRSRA